MYMYIVYFGIYTVHAYALGYNYVCIVQFCLSVCYAMCCCFNCTCSRAMQVRTSSNFTERTSSVCTTSSAIDQPFSCSHKCSITCMYGDPLPNYLIPIAMLILGPTTKFNSSQYFRLSIHHEYMYFLCILLVNADQVHVLQLLNVSILLSYVYTIICTLICQFHRSQGRYCEHQFLLLHPQPRPGWGVRGPPCGKLVRHSI